MANELEDTRARLVSEWEKIPDLPPIEDVERLCERSCKLVALIDWIDNHPDATREEYRAELSRVQQARLDAPRRAA